MSTLNKPRTIGLNTSLEADSDTAVAESELSDSIDLNEFTPSSVPQRDYLQLMLAQLRRLENLEQENRKLLAERYVLNEKYQEQLQIVAALKSEKALDCSSEQASNNSQSKAQTLSIDELPAIDASEFQPLRDRSGDTGLTQGYKAVADKTAALSSTVKSSASWCGKKVVSILT